MLCWSVKMFFSKTLHEQEAFVKSAAALLHLQYTNFLGRVCLVQRDDKRIENVQIKTWFVSNKKFIHKPHYSAHQAAPALY